MAQLAIKGHSNRGDEVIEILEMLGGKNETHIKATVLNAFYYINEDGKMYLADKYSDMSNFVIYTLEEFLEKFPYKVGDKVQHKDATSCGSIFEIEKMRWVNNDVEYIVKRLWHTNCQTTCTAKDLQPYKEEIVDTGCCSMPTIPPSYKLSVKQPEKMKQTIVFSNDSTDEIELVLGDNYEVKVKEGKTYVVKKKPKYPKTFVECAKILDCFCAAHIDGYYCRLLEDLQVLLICRDAYWKIAGDWKPDVMYCDLYCIGYDGNVITWKMQGGCRLLVFPTEEMRDAFYENFKELIEECKELL